MYSACSFAPSKQLVLPMNSNVVTNGSLINSAGENGNFKNEFHLLLDPDRYVCWERHSTPMPVPCPAPAGLYEMGSPLHKDLVTYNDGGRCRCHFRCKWP